MSGPLSWRHVGLTFSHRLFHVPQVTNAVVAHFAEDLSEVLELAEHNSSYAIYDQDALQYFAARKCCSVSTYISANSTDVYALEVAGGGDACIGQIEHSHADDSHSHAASSTSAASAASSTAVPAASATSASADIPAPPAESTGCVLHVDHYHCEGPAAATSAAAAAQQTGDCHTHADGGES